MLSVVCTILVLCMIFLLLWWKTITSPFRHIKFFWYNIPIFGHSFRYSMDPAYMVIVVENMFKEINSKTGVFWAAVVPYIFSIDVSHYESILKSNLLITKSQEYKLFQDWLGDGLLLSNGDKWRKRRHLLTPAFHFNILTSFSEIMNVHAKQFVSNLKVNASGSVIEFQSLSKYFTLDLLCETVMGIRQDSFAAGENSIGRKYVEAVDELLNVIAERFRKPWFHSNFLFHNFSSRRRDYYKNLNFIKSYVKSVVENRISYLKDNSIQSNIFLDILIAAYKRNEIDIEGILDEVNNFMFAGHDTVSSAISWTVYLIGCDRRVQDKVFAEVSDFSESLTPENVKKLKYLDCVIKESLRLHSPAPAVSRSLKKGTTLESGLHLPQATSFYFFFYHMHRNESVWKDAQSFFPERFEEEEFLHRNPYSYIPFSAGPRNCIGQKYALLELKVVMFNLIKNFRFESTQVEKDLRVHIDVVHKACNGIWMKIHRR